MKFFQSCIPIVIVLALCLCSGCNKAAPKSGAATAGQWKEFVAPADGFAVSFPGAPKREISSEDTERGPIATTQYRLIDTAHETTGIYCVNYHDNPPGVVPKIAVNVFLGIAWQNIWGKLPGHTVQWKRETLVEGYPAIEFQLLNASGTMMTTTGRMVQVKDRSYQMYVVLPTRRQNSGDAENFLQSFRLTQ